MEEITINFNIAFVDLRINEPKFRLKHLYTIRLKLNDSKIDNNNIIYIRKVLNNSRPVVAQRHKV